MFEIRLSSLPWGLPCWNPRETFWDVSEFSLCFWIVSKHREMDNISFWVVDEVTSWWWSQKLWNTVIMTNVQQVTWPVCHGMDKMAGVRKLGNIVLDQTAFFLCDMQEKFRPAIKYFPDILEVSKRMVWL